MQFSQTSGVSSPTDLIPSGFLCWAMLTFRGMKNSQSSDSRYADIELTVADKQPCSRKKLWTKVADPDHGGNSEAYRNVGMVSLTRMVEACGIVDPKNPASYENLNGRTCEQIFMLLDGKYVAIRVKVEKGDGAYQDKNEVGDFLTPNEQSSSYKNFVKLSNGDHGVTVGANQNGQQRPGPAAGFASASAGNSNAQSGGFQQPAQQQHKDAQPQTQGQSDRPFPGENTSTSASTRTSPSSGGGFNPNAAPAFLQHHQR